MLSPATRREGLLHVGSLPSLCTYLQPWRSTARGLRSFRTYVSDLHNHTNASRRPQRAMQTVLCKWPLTTYNLYWERNCCTMHTAKATDVLGPILHLPRGTSANWLTFFILCLRRQYAATVAVTAATQSSMPVSNLHEVCLWRRIWIFASVRPGHAHNT